MPLGIVSDEQFMEELEELNRPAVRVPRVTVEELTPRGRSDGDTNVPDSLRKVIGETAVIEGRQAALQLAKDFGISASSVSAYANGATSTKSYDSPSQSIIQHINKSRRRAISKAQKTLNGALGAITQEKLDYADPKDLASIAKDMTVVIKNLEPPAQPVEANSNSPQFVIFAPTFRKEESFEVIDVKE